MGSNICTHDDSSNIATVVIDKKPEVINQPKKINTSGTKNSQTLTSQSSGQILSSQEKDLKNQEKQTQRENLELKSQQKVLKIQDKPLKNQNRTCSNCEDPISLTFVQLNCKNNCCYHHLCMEEHLKKLIDCGKPLIKCKCGTKLNTNCLRQSSIIGKMNLLSRLFEKQLDLILQSSQQIRRDVEVQNYVQQNRISKELQDYFLMKQDSLIYEETPQ